MPRQTLKQRKDGRYICRCDDRYFVGKTQKEALAAREAYKLAKAQGLRAELRGVTTNAYAAKWLPIAKANVTNCTYNGYVRLLNRFIEKFNNVPLQNICPTDISANFALLNGRSKSYICKYTQLITAMFRSACEDGIIIRSPVTRSVTIPDGFAGTHRALEPWERQLIVDSVDKHDFAPAAMLMLFAGLRRGEMLAFNIDRDVDFDLGVLHVREAITFNNFQPILTTTKTKAGIRTIPLFKPLRNALQGKHGLVLPNTKGGYMGYASLQKKQDSYQAYLERQLNNGCYRLWYGRKNEHKDLIASGKSLPPWKTIVIRNHDYRHTFATMLWEANVDLKSAIKWMGHTNENMMLRVYAHLTTKKEQESALAMAHSIESSFTY